MDELTGFIVDTGEEQEIPEAGEFALVDGEIIPLDFDSDD